MHTRLVSRPHGSAMRSRRCLLPFVMAHFPLISRALSVLGHLIRRVECHIRCSLSVASACCVSNSQDTFPAAPPCRSVGVPGFRRPTGRRNPFSARPSRQSAPFSAPATSRPRRPSLSSNGPPLLSSCLSARGPRPPPLSLCSCAV
ncbi:Piso0_005855 [Millerozyma farinosa CBS 7064]|uniref:Piso0_005855 protein n=1 Tax=Pichia sorbitophila (strain ATCC MYA-4447 / BCRC 22081 / CBS 7064 / NBRC 10061 / NRRL Y-12695) TaxID=559304 RepID=G8Y048_PICSO|nr:Piso0_005855 [Millerozyma farinosa CBS 7064]